MPPHESDAVDADTDSCLRDVLSPRESDVRDSNEAARLYEVLPPVRTPRETHRPSPDHLRGRECPCCGYDLRGIEGRVCPECGEEYESARRRHVSLAARRYESWGWLAPFRWVVVGVAPMLLLWLPAVWFFGALGAGGAGCLEHFIGLVMVFGLAAWSANRASDEVSAVGEGVLLAICTLLLVLLLNLIVLIVLPTVLF